jgi:hypothetical protein
MKWIKLFESFAEIENIILVGGGISSLYCAYLIKKKMPKVKFTIFESSDKIGGRVTMEELSGVKLHTGALFTKIQKDKTLGKLLKDLDVKVKPYELKIDYNFKKSDIEAMLVKLKKGIKEFPRHDTTFKEFGISVLGKQDYQKFITMMGYTDFEGYDYIDALQNYGLDDNVAGYKIATVPWDEVCQKLEDFIGKKNIKTGTKITSIKKSKNGWLVNSKYSCDAIILGVTVEALKSLIDYEIYDDIKSQSFIKVFAESEDIGVKNYTVVDSPLRKIIPVEDDVFNIAFADNKDAKFLEDKNRAYFERELQEQFSKKIQLKNVKKFFWKEGTHYFTPLKKTWKSREKFIYDAQHPQDNMWVIGEMVALKQGWVNGALESVHNISLFK